VELFFIFFGRKTLSAFGTLKGLRVGKKIKKAGTEGGPDCYRDVRPKLLRDQFKTIIDENVKEMLLQVFGGKY
jgi:hypothetical protein